MERGALSLLPCALTGSPQPVTNPPKRPEGPGDGVVGGVGSNDASHKTAITIIPVGVGITVAAF